MLNRRATLQGLAASVAAMTIGLETEAQPKSRYFGKAFEGCYLNREPLVSVESPDLESFVDDLYRLVPRKPKLLLEAHFPTKDGWFVFWSSVIRGAQYLDQAIRNLQYQARFVQTVTLEELEHRGLPTWEMVVRDGVSNFVVLGPFDPVQG